MLLTHLCLFQFLDGASPSTRPPATNGFGGSNALPPYFLFDGFSPANPPTPIVEIDTHDGGKRIRRRTEEYVRKQQELREDLLAAVRQADGILDIEPEVLEIKQAIPQAFTKSDVARIAAEVREIYLRVEAKRREDEDDDDDVLLLLNG